DRNRSHWSTSKTPSYTKSVSWQHHLEMHENKKMKIFIFIGTWLIIMYAPENDIYIICIATNNDNFLLVIVYYYSG
ncbi:hypothetical protein ACNITI_23225, partial [Escherichia coli]